MCVEVFVYSKHTDFHIDSVNEMKEIFFKHCLCGFFSTISQTQAIAGGDLLRLLCSLRTRREASQNSLFFLSDWIRKSTFWEFFITFDASFAVLLTMFEIHFCFDNNLFLMALLRSEFSPDLHLTQPVVLDRILDTFLSSNSIKSLIKANISTAAYPP